MRRMILLALTVAALFLCFAAPAMAQGVSLPGDETLQIRVDYWVNQLNAIVKITTGTLEGTSVDAFDTLGMDVHQQTPVAVVGSYSLFGFRMDYWRNTYLGDKNLDEPVIFNGTLYPVGDHLQSKLVIDSFDVRAFLDVLPQDKLDLYPMAGIKYKRYEIWLEDLTTSTSDNEVLHAPLPYVGGGIRFNVSDEVSFGGELGIMNVTFTEYDLQIKDFMDFYAYAEVRLTSMFALVGGFRYTKYRLFAKKDDVDYSLNEDIQGMFVGAALMF